MAEAIHIELEGPILNRDRGRHTLPTIYKEVITSRDHPSSILRASLMHQLMIEFPLEQE